MRDRYRAPASEPARGLLFGTLEVMRTRAVLACLALLAIAGCNTPSIPIPPPEPANMVFEVDVAVGESTFRYPPNDNYADAIVFVFNRDAGTGVIDTARSDGSVGPTAPFPTEDGDEIAVTFEAEEQVVSTCIVLRDGAASGTEYCGY